MRHRALVGFGCDADARRCWGNAGRGVGSSATLTCHFLQLLTLAVSSLASGVIQLCSQALLVGAVGTAALLKPRLVTTLPAAVTLPAKAATADIKDQPTCRASTDLLAKLAWQGALVFLKAGLDNERRSWQAMGQEGGPLIGSARFTPQALTSFGAFLFLPLESQHMPAERETPAAKQLKRKSAFDCYQ